MALDRIILYMIGGIAALMAVVYVIGLAVGAIALGPIGIVIFIPVAIVGYIVWRIISERLQNAEDDYYDNIEH